jgi:DNA-damage-inducible protein D
VKNNLTKRDGLSPFDQIRQIREDSSEYWSARDLAPLLGYPKSDWRYFEKVIEKAKIACQKSNQSNDHHFVVNNKMIKIASGSQKEAIREISDFHLSRYACYLVAQNGNPNKEEIANAQTYFAVKTHEREQDEQRIYLKKRKEKRDKLTTSIKALNSAAKQKGVTSKKQFADFTDAGTKGLYGGLTTAQIKKKKNVPSKANLQDRMGLDELTANDFAKMLARREVESMDDYGANKATEVNFNAHERVRKDMKDFGKTMPEDLLAEPDIDISEKRLKNLNKAYCKTFTHHGEKIMEIHLPDNFTVLQKDQLRDLLDENQGMGVAMLYWSAKNMERRVSFGVNCTRKLISEVEKIFSDTTEKLK